jgi:hypothetical protein
MCIRSWSDVEARSGLALALSTGIVTEAPTVASRNAKPGSVPDQWEPRSLARNFDEKENIRHPARFVKGFARIHARAAVGQMISKTYTGISISVCIA